MPRLPVISGEKLAKILIKQKGYVVRSKKGSHVNLVHRELPPVTIPLHRELARGLISSILKLTGLGQDEL